MLGEYPQTRQRRLRLNEWSRRLVAENRLSIDDLIWPVFVREQGIDAEIKSMPGVRRYLLEELVDAVGHAVSLGIRVIALFAVIPAEKRDGLATEATNPDGVLASAIKLLRENFPDLGVITDVALDAYTDHGHDGILYNGDVDNDSTLKKISEVAVLHAQLGVQIIAPSEMMDGRIKAIRQSLDDAHFSDVNLMSYSAKYASAYYGPFRDALKSSSCLGQGHKKTYQMDPANGNEAMREVALDLREGADMVMVKPGLPYLDVIHQVKSTFGVPTFCYNVSGEYAMIKSASLAGVLDYDRAVFEALLSFKRAGADGILTYSALDAARLIKQGFEL